MSQFLLLAALAVIPNSPPPPPTDYDLHIVSAPHGPSVPNTCEDHGHGLHSWIGPNYTCVGNDKGEGACVDDEGNKWSEQSPCVP